MDALTQKSDKIVETLQSFGIFTRVISNSEGPRHYKIVLHVGSTAKGNKTQAQSVKKYKHDLEIALGSKVDISIDASGVIITVNKDTPESVDYSQFEFVNDLDIPIGINTSGFPIVADVARMPHLLVAGTTGSGKSNFLGNIITRLLHRDGPYLVLIDPKKVEFGVYEDSPKVMRVLDLPKIITSVDDVVTALDWLINLMDGRYAALSQAKAKNIQEYNRVSKNYMPPVVVIVDEMADIMMQDKSIEDRIVRLAQKSRAAGIHLVLSTQRPTVSVVTGNIKANIATRISFRLPTKTDSRVILDSDGAELLGGSGDGLFLSQGITTRFQAPLVNDKDIQDAVNINKKGLNIF